MVVRGEREKEKRRKGGGGGGKNHGTGLGRPGMGNCRGAGLTEVTGSGVGFLVFLLWLDGRRAEGQDQHVGKKKRLEKAIGRKWRFTEIRQAEIRPVEIFQIGTESSSHDLGEEMGLDCRSGVNE